MVPRGLQAWLWLQGARVGKQVRVWPDELAQGAGLGIHQIGLMTWWPSTWLLHGNLNICVLSYSQLYPYHPPGPA